MSYVYIQSEPGLFTVGFYDPNGRWQAESDHGSRGEAAERVAYLNGTGSPWTGAQNRIDGDSMILAQRRAKALG